MFVGNCSWNVLECRLELLVPIDLIQPTNNKKVTSNVRFHTLVISKKIIAQTQSLIVWLELQKKNAENCRVFFFIVYNVLTISYKCS